MRERKVVITWEAIYDVTDIADYIEQDVQKAFPAVHYLLCGEGAGK